jgi:hypothetical protein
MKVAEPGETIITDSRVGFDDQSWSDYGSRWEGVTALNAGSTSPLFNGNDYFIPNDIAHGTQI